MTTTTASLATTLKDLGGVFVEGLAVFALAVAVTGAVVSLAVAIWTLASHHR